MKLWQDTPGTVTSALSHLRQDSCVFPGGMWVLLAVTLQAALELPNGPNGNWLLKEESNTAYCVHQTCPVLGKAQLEAKAGW